MDITVLPLPEADRQKAGCKLKLRRIWYHENQKTYS